MIKCWSWRLNTEAIRNLAGARETLCPELDSGRGSLWISLNEYMVFVSIVLGANANAALFSTCHSSGKIPPFHPNLIRPRHRLANCTCRHPDKRRLRISSFTPPCIRVSISCRTFRRIAAIGILLGGAWSSRMVKCLDRNF